MRKVAPAIWHYWLQYYQRPHARRQRHKAATAIHSVTAAGYATRLLRKWEDSSRRDTPVDGSGSGSGGNASSSSSSSSSSISAPSLKDAATAAAVSAADIGVDDAGDVTAAKGRCDALVFTTGVLETACPAVPSRPPLASPSTPPSAPPHLLQVSARSCRCSSSTCRQSVVGRHTATQAQERTGNEQQGRDAFQLSIRDPFPHGCTCTEVLTFRYAAVVSRACCVEATSAAEACLMAAASFSCRSCRWRASPPNHRTKHVRARCEFECGTAIQVGVTLQTHLRLPMASVCGSSQRDGLRIVPHRFQLRLHKQSRRGEHKAEFDSFDPNDVNDTPGITSADARIDRSIASSLSSENTAWFSRSTAQNRRQYMARLDAVDKHERTLVPCTDAHTLFSHADELGDAGVAAVGRFCGRNDCAGDGILCGCRRGATAAIARQRTSALSTCMQPWSGSSVQFCHRQQNTVEEPGQRCHPMAPPAPSHSARQLEDTVGGWHVPPFKMPALDMELERCNVDAVFSEASDGLGSLPSTAASRRLMSWFSFSNTSTY